MTKITSLFQAHNNFNKRKFTISSHFEIPQNLYLQFKNSLIIHEQNTKKIIAVKESLYVIKHTKIFTKLLPRFSRLIQHLYSKFFRKQSDKMGIKWIVFEAIQNTRNSCFIRYKTLDCASRFISDKALMLVRVLNSTYDETRKGRK